MNFIGNISNKMKSEISMNNVVSWIEKLSWFWQLSEGLNLILKAENTFK